VPFADANGPVIQRGVAPVGALKPCPMSVATPTLHGAVSQQSRECAVSRPRAMQASNAGSSPLISLPCAECGRAAAAVAWPSRSRKAQQTHPPHRN